MNAYAIHIVSCLHSVYFSNKVWLIGFPNPDYKLRNLL